MKKFYNAKISRSLWLFISFAMLCFIMACGGSLGGDDGGDDGGSNTTVTPATLDLLASPPTVKSDGSTTSTITITAKNALNATISGVVITMSASDGNLNPATVTTGSEGTATATFSSGGPPSGPINRTSTITATAGTVSSQVPIEVVGSTVTLIPSKTSLTNDGLLPATLTITARNAGGYGVNGAAVTLTQSSTDGGSVTFGSTSGVANSSGVFTTTAAGASAGTVIILARSLGASASANVTIDTVAETFAIDYQELNGTEVTGNPDPTAMVFGDNLLIQVNVPSTSTSNVIFATNIGTWSVSGTTTQEVIPNPITHKATSILNTGSAGTATVEVYLKDTPTTKDSLTVIMSSGAVADNIILQATPTVVPINTGTATITATVRDSGGYVVPNAPIAFSIVNPTGGGETISPVVGITGTNGMVSTTFHSGSLPSYDAGGVKIHATVVGSAPVVETGLMPSGADAAVVIGGLPGSISFGMATLLQENINKTQYLQPMSVLVADINGNPVAGAVVSLSVWPIAWSTGKDFACSWDSDYMWDYTDPLLPVLTTTIDGSKGTFLNEDADENLILGLGEDGNRTFYYPIPIAHDADGIADGTPTYDSAITPTNSAGGAVPTTVTTGTDGVATFNLTYPKDSAIWTVVRIRASTIVQGSETVGQRIFRLFALQSDVSPCKLLCPYEF